MSLLVSSKKYDKTLLGLTLALATVGTVMIFSSSINRSMDMFGVGTYYFKRHMIRVVIGLIVMFLFMHIDYQKLKKFAAPLLIFTIIILLITKISYTLRGSTHSARWLYVGSFGWQTSDLARFAIILYLASYIDDKRDQINDFIYGFLPPIVMVGLIMTLIIIQPDFSTAIMIAVIMGTLLFVGKAKISHLMATTSTGLAIIIPVMLIASYRLERIKSFLTFGSDLGGMNYQVKQSLTSLGNGGLFGVGLGESVGKNLFLPEPHTDFIMSIIGEEFGFIGTFIILTLFLAIFQRGIKISKNCTDIFGIMLAIGISVKMITYAFINSAVVTALVPTTGLPIPFISFGGTGLVVNMMTIGILLNISMAKRSVRHKKGARILFAK